MSNIKEMLSKLTISFPAFAVIVIILFIIIPFPAIVLDIFIRINLLFAILILLIILNTKKITDFSFLPAILLISTVFTLAINISIVRTILSGGAEYDGKIIRFLSNLIAGSGDMIQLWIGFAVFYLFLFIEVVIITKGGTRAAEVAARWTLDAMQIRMLAIETEFSAGVITEEQAQIKKLEIQKESDFYGSLDGAMKFISGNTKVTIFIIFLLILSGTVIDYLLREAALFEALKTYIQLSIGCGFIFLLPIFIISLAVGISVTRLISSINEKGK